MKRQRQLVVYDENTQVDHVAALRADFELIPAAVPESLLQLIASEPLHGVIFHSDILTPAQIVSIEEIRALTAFLPSIVLADYWELDVARNCGQIGIDTVLACSEKQEKKIAAMSSALRAGGFRKLLAEAGRSPKAWPIRMKNAYELIFSNFPKVLHVSELSTSLGIHRRNLERDFRKTFGLSYVHFVRVLRMYESWHLMKYTDLNNLEIASYLGYHEETHFARDCRHLFHQSPKQLRKLSEKDFRDLLKKAFCR